MYHLIRNSFPPRSTVNFVSGQIKASYKGRQSSFCIAAGTEAQASLWVKAIQNKLSSTGKSSLSSQLHLRSRVEGKGPLGTDDSYQKAHVAKLYIAHPTCSVLVRRLICVCMEQPKIIAGLWECFELAL